MRRAHAQDAEQLARCRLEMFRELDHDPSPAAATRFEALCEQTLLRLMSTSEATGWLAETSGDNEVIGSVVLLSFPRLPTFKNPGTTEGYLGTVFVSREWRRRGVGTTLAYTAIEYAREAGLARVRLHAEPDARVIYERAGFTGRDDEMELNLIFSDAV